MTGRRLLARYVTLVTLRWLPAGLLIPVTVLLAADRGLSVPQIGAVFAVQGVVVLALELPTGGLADALGRRPVLLASSVVGLASLVVLYHAHSVWAFVAALALQGVYRALDSGPLEAWYVDAAQAADPDAPIERGLAAGNVALSVAIGVGSAASGGLVALAAASGEAVALGPVGGVDPLAVPLLAALVLQALGGAAIVALVTEPRRATTRRAVAGSVRDVPRAVGGGLRLLRRSRVLLALVLVETLWGFGMVTFETLLPLRLADVAGGADAAAALMGPVSSVAWLASAAGAALVPLASRRLGVAATAAGLRVLQGATVVGMGLLAGPLGVIAAFVACYTVHGASNPLHQTLLHRQADAANRATVLSINSMAGQPAFAAGAVVLTALAGAASVTAAMLVGAAVLAAAAPLYLPAARQERTTGGTARSRTDGSDPGGGARPAPAAAAAPAPPSTLR